MAKKQIVTFLSTGDTLSILGNQTYAYSGMVASGGSSTTPATKMLEFRTPNQPMRAKFNVTNDVTSTTSDVSYKIEFNGITVFYQILKDEVDKQGRTPNNLELVIPPRTLVSCYSDTAADPHNFTWTVAGKLYA